MKENCIKIEQINLKEIASNFTYFFDHMCVINMKIFNMHTFLMHLDIKQTAVIFPESICLLLI